MDFYLNEETNFLQNLPFFRFGKSLMTSKTLSNKNQYYVPYFNEFFINGMLFIIIISSKKINAMQLIEKIFRNFILSKILYYYWKFFLSLKLAKIQNKFKWTICTLF